MALTPRATAVISLSVGALLGAFAGGFVGTFSGYLMLQSTVGTEESRQKAQNSVVLKGDPMLWSAVESASPRDSFPRCLKLGGQAGTALEQVAQARQAVIKR